MTTELEMAKNGEFLREYGKQYFVVASEALSIGRVKWNMVPIGNKGQGDITFYLTTEQMWALCHEITNGVFAKKLAADTGAYPGAYKYVTGEDGCLHLNIGGGKMGCRVQLQDAKAKTNYTMAVSVEAMTTMARKYLLCAGLTPVAPGSYYASVVSAFEQGRVDRSKFRKPAPEELGDVINANSIVDEPVESAAPVEPVPQVEPSKPAVEPQTNVTDTSANFTLTIRGGKSIKKGFFVFEGTDAQGAAISLMFRKEDAATLNWFEKFENAAAVGETTLTIKGEKRDNFILYKGSASK